MTPCICIYSKACNMIPTICQYYSKSPWKLGANGDGFISLPRVPAACDVFKSDVYKFCSNNVS